MLSKVKRRLYFVVASYFSFWARFVLRRWRPRIVVVTGSSGKTSTLHLIEAQLGEKAIYSHHANSSFGIPFDILGLHPNIEAKLRWLTYTLVAPFKIFRPLPKTNLYIVEADCDRPNEGKFLSNLLKPEITLWVSVFRTHSMNFDRVVKNGSFKTHEEAIAYEFGYFAEATTGLVIANGTQEELTAQLNRVDPKTDIKIVKDLIPSDYKLKDQETIFTIQGQQIHLPGLHPIELGINLGLVNELMQALHEPVHLHYPELTMPPGRSSVFAGKNGTILVDSTYNTGLGAMTAIIHLFDQYPNNHKWLVLGDILEQGSLEKSEHENLAELILTTKVDCVVLLGPRTRSHTLPILKQKLSDGVAVESFESPKEVLDYLEANLKGGEVLLFKGGRFLEGVIEQLLQNPADAAKLVRRESAWVKKRQKWGLPR